jgi:signal peptidase I
MNNRRSEMLPKGSHKDAVQKTSSGKKSVKQKDTFRETTEAIIIALIAAMFLRAFVVQAFRIPTGSMKDTLLVGDFLLVNKFIYGVRTPDHIPLINAEIPFIRLPAFKEPKNGDIVVFKYPKDESLDYIKRCIAVGGQTVEVRHGEVFVNGKPEGEKTDLGKRYDERERDWVRLTRIDTPYRKSYTIRHYEQHNANDPSHNYGPVTVPDNHYFMMGDNRDNSADSRSWGFLPHQNVEGEALIIYFSWNDTAKNLWNLFESVRWPRIANIIR